VGAVFSRPEFHWVERRRVLGWLANLWNNVIEWLDRLAEQHPVGYTVGLIIIIVLVVMLLTHIAYVVWRIVRPAVATPKATSAGTGVIVDAATHLAYANELARAGRFTEALAHRFLAVLLELERLKALRFHASKTPAEYVGEARLDDPGRATLAALVAQLYRHLFGAVPCAESEYRQFGAAAEQLVRGAHVVPA
jgi:hypothetical protein